MKNIFSDSLCKRIFTIAVSVSMILLSCSLFITSIPKAYAGESDRYHLNGGNSGNEGIGIIDRNAYFLDGNGKLKYIDITDGTRVR